VRLPFLQRGWVQLWFPGYPGEDALQDESGMQDKGKGFMDLAATGTNER
jgi:hypothetical protein